MGSERHDTGKDMWRGEQEKQEWKEKRRKVDEKVQDKKFRISKKLWVEKEIWVKESLWVSKKFRVKKKLQVKRLEVRLSI